MFEFVVNRTIKINVKGKNSNGKSNVTYKVFKQPTHTISEIYFISRPKTFEKIICCANYSIDFSMFLFRVISNKEYDEDYAEELFKKIINRINTYNNNDVLINLSTCIEQYYYNNNYIGPNVLINMDDISELYFYKLDISRLYKFFQKYVEPDYYNEVKKYLDNLPIYINNIRSYNNFKQNIDKLHKYKINFDGLIINDLTNIRYPTKKAIIVLQEIIEFIKKYPNIILFVHPNTINIFFNQSCLSNRIYDLYTVVKNVSPFIDLINPRFNVDEIYKNDYNNIMKYTDIILEYNKIIQ